MRLKCPSCEAQYEVPDTVIPLAGRDVQCSNCGETWFQERAPRIAAATAEPTGRAAGTRGAAISETPAGSASPPPTAPSVPDASLPQAPAPATDNAPSPSASEVPARRPLDPNVADVLREEAELEARARRNEMAGGLETQPELGLTMVPTPRSKPEGLAPITVADDRRASGVTAAPAADKGTPRRDRLPDIERINSSLRSAETPGPATRDNAQHPEAARRGTRWGFTLMLTLAAALAVVYAFAPQIAARVPQSDPWLTSYVSAVDTGRIWLDAQAQQAMAWLDELVAPDGE